TARQAADGFERFCGTRPAEPALAALLVYFDGQLAAPLRHAGAPDESLRVADYCRRLFEELTRKYPDEPRHWIGLSEAWTHVGKTYWREGRHAETEAALRQAVAAAGQLAERWPEYRPVREERQGRLGRFLKEFGRADEAALPLQGNE